MTADTKQPNWQTIDARRHSLDRKSQVTHSRVCSGLFECLNLVCRHVLKPWLHRKHADVFPVAHVVPIRDVRLWNHNPVAPLYAGYDFRTVCDGNHGLAIPALEFSGEKVLDMALVCNPDN